MISARLFAVAVVAALLLSGCGTGSDSQAIKFAPAVNLATGGSQSASVVLADFNGDGRLDIAVSNFSSNTISVFLSGGSGTFGSPVITTIQNATTIGSIVAGDFNEDGKDDLLFTTVAAPQYEAVLLSHGDGTFTQMPPITNSHGFIAAQVIDLNGDKHLDMVAAGNGPLSVALGNGDGTFSPAQDLSLPPGSVTPFTAVAVGDINNDGKLDIAATYLPVPQASNAPDTLVFAGNGDGTFQAASSAGTTITGPDAIALADFNGDGKPDLLIGYTVGNATVVFGNGDGTFNLAPNSQSLLYATDSGPGFPLRRVTARATDMDLDGKPDAVIGDYLGNITVVLNDGNIGMTSPQWKHTVGKGLADLATGDLNGDGIPDVVFVNSLTDQISVLLSRT